MHRDEVPLEDIRNAAPRAGSYAHAMSRADFLSDDKSNAAVRYEFTITGDDATRLANIFRLEHAEVPWKRLVGLHNFYIHVCDVVSFGKVWTTIHQFAPRIEIAIAALLFERRRRKYGF